MANRSRTVKLEVYVSEEEHDLIKQKMAQAEVENFSLYARKMLIDGYVIRQDYTVLKELARELGNLSRNINQIAKRVNETRSIYASDIEDLRRYYRDVKRAVSERLVKISEKGR